MPVLPMLSDIYRLYCHRCKQADAMDFDDLLLQTNVLFRNFPMYCINISKLSLISLWMNIRILILQYLIVKKLAERHERICVVGDDAQSIYSFRGQISIISCNLKNAYNNARIFKLEQNYRRHRPL